MLLLPKAAEQGTIGDLLAGQRAREAPSPLRSKQFLDDFADLAKAEFL